MNKNTHIKYGKYRIEMTVGNDLTVIYAKSLGQVQQMMWENRTMLYNAVVYENKTGKKFKPEFYFRITEVV